jgi:predicted Rossmann fold nucleotide-binding protein DprA/Smf involved in DNA uptake
MDITAIGKDDQRYPRTAMALLGDHAPECICAMGNLDILDQPMLALFCSSQCPGSIILQTYDFVSALRNSGAPVISGFHSPVEKECLRLLLRGSQPIVICPARSIERMRIPTEWRDALAAGRLLILSPFEPHHRRVTAETAQYRNLFVAALADRILIPHAAPGSKTEAFARKVAGRGKKTVGLEDVQREGGAPWS